MACSLDCGVENCSVRIESGMQMYQEMLANLDIIPIGCESLDRLLGGGMWTSEVTEVCGPSASGKTQLCYAVLASAVLCQQRDRTSAGQILYVDTSGSFRPNRVRQMLKSRERTLNEQQLDALLSRILYVKAMDHDELIELLLKLQGQCSSTTRTYSLMIIDCIGAALHDTVLMPDLAQGRRLQHRVARLLRSIARSAQCAILTTNHVTQWNNAVRPALGQNWSSVPDTRLMVDRDPVQEGVLVATLANSNRQPVGGSVSYRIGSRGLMDLHETDYYMEHEKDKLAATQAAAERQQLTQQRMKTAELLRSTLEWNESQSQYFDD